MHIGKLDLRDFIVLKEELPNPLSGTTYVPLKENLTDEKSE